jgi:hypothetical protein
VFDDATQPNVPRFVAQTTNFTSLIRNIKHVGSWTLFDILSKKWHVDLRQINNCNPFDWINWTCFKQEVNSNSKWSDKIFAILYGY